MRTKIILFALILPFTLTFSYAQNSEREQNMVFQIVEDMPEFPGGEKALHDYLNKCSYPTVALENHIEGSVYVRFIIERDGKVSNIEIAQGADKILNEAALECVKNMPDWEPGRQNGKLVRVQYIAPFIFSAQEDQQQRKKKKDKK